MMEMELGREKQFPAMVVEPRSELSPQGAVGAR